MYIWQRWGEGWSVDACSSLYGVAYSYLDIGTEIRYGYIFLGNGLFDSEQQEQTDIQARNHE